LPVHVNVSRTRYTAVPSPAFAITAKSGLSVYAQAHEHGEGHARVLAHVLGQVTSVHVVLLVNVAVRLPIARPRERFTYTLHGCSEPRVRDISEERERPRERYKRPGSSSAECPARSSKSIAPAGSLHRRQLGLFRRHGAMIVVTVQQDGAAARVRHAALHRAITARVGRTPKARRSDGRTAPPLCGTSCARS
jgi:hypothetical protein